MAHQEQTPSVTASAPAEKTPWTAELGNDGFHLVFNAESVVIAEKMVQEEAQLLAAAPELLDALDYLLEQTVDQDLAYGIELTEGEQEARKKALAAIAQAYGNPA